MLTYTVCINSAFAFLIVLALILAGGRDVRPNARLDETPPVRRRMAGMIASHIPAKRKSRGAA